MQYIQRTLSLSFVLLSLALFALGCASFPLPLSEGTVNSPIYQIVLNAEKNVRQMESMDREEFFKHFDLNGKTAFSVLTSEEIQTQKFGNSRVQGGYEEIVAFGKHLKRLYGVSIPIKAVKKVGWFSDYLTSFITKRTGIEGEGYDFRVVAIFEDNKLDKFRLAGEKVVGGTTKTYIWDLFRNTLSSAVEIDALTIP